jgi:hypothetical protein
MASFFTNPRIWAHPTLNSLLPIDQACPGSQGQHRLLFDRQFQGQIDSLDTSRPLWNIHVYTPVQEMYPGPIIKNKI